MEAASPGSGSQSTSGPNITSGVNTVSGVQPASGATQSVSGSEGGSEPSVNCPTCHSAFDEGRRRRLIDSCGHERCYTCMFAEEACPICEDLAGRSKVRTNGHFKSIKARFENIAAAKHSNASGPSNQVPSNRTLSQSDQIELDESEEEPPEVLPRKPVKPLPRSTEITDHSRNTTIIPQRHSDHSGNAANPNQTLPEKPARSHFGSKSGPKPEIPRKNFLTSSSSPSLSTLDRVFKLEGYADKPKNRRPVMGTSTNTKLEGPPCVTGPIVPSPANQSTGRHHHSNNNKQDDNSSPPPPVPARQPKTVLSSTLHAPNKKQTPPLPVPPRATPRRQFSTPAPPIPSDDIVVPDRFGSGFNSSFSGLNSSFSGSYSGFGLLNSSFSGLNSSFSGSTISSSYDFHAPHNNHFGRGTTGNHRARHVIPGSDNVYASVEDIRKGVTSYMNRLRDEHVMQSSLHSDTSTLLSSSLKDTGSSFHNNNNVAIEKEPDYGGHKLTLNERGFLEQSGVRRKSTTPTSSNPVPISNSHRQNSFGNGTTFGNHTTTNDASFDTNAPYSRSVPANSYGYSKAMSMSTSALSNASAQSCSGQNTCDSGIGSECMHASSERLAHAHSKASLQSDTSLERGIGGGRKAARAGGKGNARKNEATSVLHEDDEYGDSEPPPPEIAQNDLMMRLGLLLGDRIATSGQSTPVNSTSGSSLSQISVGHPKQDPFPSPSPSVEFSPLFPRKNQDGGYPQESRSYRGQGHFGGGAMTPESPRSSCAPSPRMGVKFSPKPGYKPRVGHSFDGSISSCFGSTSGHHTSGLRSRDQSVESVASLASSGGGGGVMTSVNGQTTSPESTLSCHSNQSAPAPGNQSAGAPSLMSPSAPRPHSITTSAPGQVEELFGKRKSSVRRSARSNMSRPVQDHTPTKVRFPPIKPPNILLKKLHFEVPHMETPSVFVGREWLFSHILQELQSGNARSQGVVISGYSGSGKTAIVEQLVEHSFYGEGHTLLVKHRNHSSTRRASATPRQTPSHANTQPRTQPNTHSIPGASPLSSHKQSPTTASASSISSSGSSPTSGHDVISGNYDALMTLAESVVAYHVCAADNNITCTLPEFVHSIAAYLACSPLLTAYRDLLLQGSLQTALSIKQCIEDPSRAFIHGILEPLRSLKANGHIHADMCLLVVDALNEAEFHKPDHGDTIASFLARHIGFFPAWFKVVVTVSSELEETTRTLPFTRIFLNPTAPSPIKLASLQNMTSLNAHDACIVDDVSEYVMYRVTSSPTVSQNLALGKTKSGSEKTQDKAREKFICFVINHAQGSMLYAKLLINLIEGGSLVLKSTNFKILPANMTDIFLLLFNLKFPTIRSFEKVVAILNVCLATLYPLTKQEIFEAVNSNFVRNFIDMADFSQRIVSLGEFLWQRRDGTFVLFHPAFRDWLCRREEGESEKFLCDLRSGHTMLAFRLSRVERPLVPDKTLELGHHVLKAHIYKNMSRQLGFASKHVQAQWMSTCARDLHAALTCPHNVFSPNVKVSRLLLLAGADPNTSTAFMQGAPLLCVAAHLGLYDVVNLLLEFGANVNASGDDGKSALCYASQQGHVTVMRRLVECHARINQCDNEGLSPAVYAARFGQLDALNVLLQYDWSMYHDKQPIRNEVMQQSLVIAAAEGHAQICDFLLNLAGAAGGGFHINYTDTLSGQTALTAATTHCRTHTVRHLLSRGAVVDVCNTSGQAPSICAAMSGHWEGLELLLQAGAGPEMCDRQQRTALMWAAAEGQQGALDLLLNHGASVLLADRDGLTALSWACARGHPQCVTSLLEHGARLEHADRHGRTALDLAAQHGNPLVVQYLLEKGADMEHTDSSGTRPLDRAIGANNTSAVTCFLRKGAKLGPVTWAMAQGKSEIIVQLLNKLMEDGNILYRRARIKDAAHRYQYALKKLPVSEGYGDEGRTFRELKVNLLLNLSRCKRKTNEFSQAIELATMALEIKPKSYEALYARARAFRDVREHDRAQRDLVAASKIAPDNADVCRLLARVQLELESFSEAEKLEPNMDTADSSASHVTHKESSTPVATETSTVNPADISNKIQTERIPSSASGDSLGNQRRLPLSKISFTNDAHSTGSKTDSKENGVVLSSSDRKPEETDL